MAGTVLCVALMVPLAIPGYMLGSWRWLRRTRSMWEMSFILFACFIPWYIALRVSGGSQVLVPIAMVVLGGGFGAGRAAYERQLRARRSK